MRSIALSALAIAARPLLLSARKFSDSGRKICSTTAITRGVSPPSQSTPRQPIVLSRAADSRPATIEPSDSPLDITTTMVARQRRGQYSPVRAKALGMAPPRPTPVRKRKAIRVSFELAQVVSRVNRPNMAVQATITGLRPNRSARGASSRKPAMSPPSPEEKIKPRALLGRCQALAMMGAR